MTSLEPTLALLPDPLLVGPIVGGAPAGVDLAYDPDFELLSAEIEKLTSLSGEPTDWPLVAFEAGRILREKSKDLRVMSWFVAAKAHTEGLPGIASGLATYRAIAEAHWPALYPPITRLRARAGQVEWLWGVLAKRVAALSVGADDAEAVRAVEVASAALGGFFSEVLKASDPGMGVFRVALREKVRALPPPREAPPPRPAAAPSLEVEAEGESAPPTVPTIPPLAPRPGEAPKAPAAPPRASEGGSAAAAVPAVAVPVVSLAEGAGLEGAKDAALPLREPLVGIAHHARRAAPLSPWPYRVLRAAAWLTVERAPEANGKKTELRGPRAQDRELCAKLHASSQWDALLEASEELAATHIFWLDPHRYSALALAAKGAEGSLARAAVTREVCTFVARVPGLVHLEFSNGTPFASAETADWLAAESAPSREGPTGAGPSAAEGEVLAQLEAGLSSGPPEEAFAGALVGIAALADARAHFRATLAVAKRAHAAAKLELAYALYERLLGLVDGTLEAWEPGLAGEALAGFVATGAAREKARSLGAIPTIDPVLFRRLLRLDPRAALRSLT